MNYLKHKLRISKILKNAIIDVKYKYNNNYWEMDRNFII